MSRIKSLYPFVEHWQNDCNIFIFSDPHFDDVDRKSMGYDLFEMQQVNILNKSIYGKNSTVVCLGDVGNPTYIDKIHAKKKILITGNHDGGVEKFRSYFTEIYNGPVFIAPQILLSHEPIKLPFVLNVHGHNHGGTQFEQDENGVVRGINLAGNVVGFQAFNLNDYVNNGGLKGIETQHRLTIDKRID